MLQDIDNELVTFENSLQLLQEELNKTSNEEFLEFFTTDDTNTDLGLTVEEYLILLNDLE